MKRYLIALLVIVAVVLGGFSVNKQAADKTIVIYTSTNKNDMQPLVDSFTKKTGIKVKVWKAPASDVIIRTLEESKRGKLEADLVMVNGFDMSILEKEGVVLSYKNKVSHPVLYKFLVLAYNTKLVDNPPKTYQDLLKPEYIGKLAMEIDSPEWETGLRQTLGAKFFETLQVKLENQEIRSVDGKRLLSEMVISGEVPIAINLSNSYIEAAKQKGAPVEWLPLEPVVACPEKVALLSTSKEAKLFIDFLISDNGQKAVLKSGAGAPINENIKSPLNTGFKIVEVFLLVRAY